MNCFCMRHAQSLTEGKRAPFLIALLSTCLITLLGIVYFIVLVCFAMTGKMTFPPSESVQLFGGITTAISAILMPLLFVSMHYLVPVKVKVFTLLSVVFCTLFSAFVGINRFVQLSVVRLSVLEGNTEGLMRFMPYESRSAMFALEMIGWGLFMSLALLFLGLAMGRKGLPGAARNTFFLYAFLGFVSAVAFILNSPLSVIGFAAWGCVLFVGTALLACSLFRYDKCWT